jgi:hypothetical protein
MKRKIVHRVQEYLLNPPIKLLWALSVVPPRYALIERWNFLPTALDRFLSLI